MAAGPMALEGEGVSRPDKRRELVLSQRKQRGIAGLDKAPLARRCPREPGTIPAATTTVPSLDVQPNPQI